MAIPERVVIEEEREAWKGGPFRVNVSRLRYERFNGALSETVTRINFERGDSVAVLLTDRESDVVYLVKQFRYPVYAGLAKKPGFRSSDAWTLEIVAGVIEEGESDIAIARKELREEAGFSLSSDLEHLISVYPSPGGSSEVIHVYLGYVTRDERVARGGGIESEGEDIEVAEMPLTEAMEMISSGRIRDAKTVIALQHLALLRAKQA